MRYILLALLALAVQVSAQIFPRPSGSFAARYYGPFTNVYLWGETKILSPGNAENTLSQEEFGSFQLGVDAAVPVGQKIKSSDGSGSDADSSSITLSTGRVTGVGNSGDLTLNTSVITSGSGSSYGAELQRLYMIGKQTTLTGGSQNLVFSGDPESPSFFSLEVFLTTYAEDQGDHAVVTDWFLISGFEDNNAVTVTATTPTSLGAWDVTQMTTTINVTAISGGTFNVYVTPNNVNGWNTIKATVQFRVNGNKTLGISY